MTEENAITEEGTSKGTGVALINKTPKKNPNMMNFLKSSDNCGKFTPVVLSSKFDKTGAELCKVITPIGDIDIHHVTMLEIHTIKNKVTPFYSKELTKEGRPFINSSVEFEIVNGNFQ